ALLSNQTGNGNIAVGSNNLQSITGVHGNTAIGYQTQRDNTSGSNNSTLGYSALINNETGDENVAVGMQALFFSTNSIHNVAVGYQSLYKTSGTSENVAVGYRAGEDRTAGDFNVLLGARADYYNQTGSNNVIIGKEAGHGTAAHNKSGSVLIGYQAGYNETTSNKLYIENSNSSSPLIYGDFSNDFVRINDSLQIGDPSGTGYAIPSLDGTVDQVLATDGSGSVAWTDVVDLQTACPTGFTAVTAQGRSIGCIQNDEEGTASYQNASNACFVNYGGRLPSYEEWYVALNNLALSNETDDSELMSNGGGSGGIPQSWRAGNGSLNTVSAATLGTIGAFRCWIEK
ncbi:MAG: hypothetical protein MRY83_03585, partial [Flavobacteriales bacterium]|nr:hypothetical protein [Flavobacteriales bacterium]